MADHRARAAAAVIDMNHNPAGAVADSAVHQHAAIQHHLIADRYSRRQRILRACRNRQRPKQHDQHP